ncbi:cytochrome P450 family protein [Ktedonobacter racemifer]|uniref:Cytochrome P450 n=1 Tax=Ktedonobacter racemifer DSM 44963 TaxID=485913 RepID=D6U7X6_KTERA|nr:cytochrome P450 [Ktedonobacter racemifer]EFH79987.1 cytochrome P450 [Ktedonobacter racemifer DSM 44963]
MTQSPEIDLFSSAAKANPYPSYTLVRSSDPVYPLNMEDGHTSWLITRYEDALAILKDQRFIKDFRRLLTPEQREKIREDAYSALSAHMLSADPPDHTRLRALVNISFTPRLVEQWRERIQVLANELIDAIERQEDREFDLIDAFAFPLPIVVITEMLGVPTEDRARFREWSNALLDATGKPEAILGTREKIIAFTMYLRHLIETKRQQLGDDLIGRLLVAEANGDTLNETELISMIFLLLIAGHETTVNLIGNGMLALLQYPEQKQLLQENPLLIKNAIEEFLRFHSPVAISTRRWVGEDLEFGGKQMRRGDPVLVSLAAANHDPEAFAQPDELDITRQENRHLAFGMGIHYCLGAPLARLEGQIAIRTLLQRLPNMRLAVPAEELVWRPSMLLLGVSKLPVAF